MPGLIRRYEEATNGKNSSNMDHCMQNTRKNVAIVHIQIASSGNGSKAMDMYRKLLSNRNDKNSQNYFLN